MLQSLLQGSQNGPQSSPAPPDMSDYPVDAPTWASGFPVVTGNQLADHVLADPKGTQKAIQQAVQRHVALAADPNAPTTGTGVRAAGLINSMLSTPTFGLAGNNPNPANVVLPASPRVQPPAGPKPAPPQEQLQSQNLSDLSVTAPTTGSPSVPPPMTNAQMGFKGTDDTGGAIPSVVTQQAAPDDTSYKEDERVQPLYDLANQYRTAAQNLATPQRQGLSLTQALVGLAGVFATQGNPHAQFLQQYLPALAQAAEQQYGNTTQAWEVARQNLMQNADAAAKQAQTLQQIGAENYKTEVGYQGKKYAADKTYQGKVDQQTLKNNAGNFYATLKNNAALAATAFKAIQSGVPGAETEGYTMLNSIPGFERLSPQDMQAYLTQLSPAQKLQVANAGRSQAQQQLYTDQANKVRTLTPILAKQYMADINLKEEQANKLAQWTALAPQETQIRMQNAVTNAYRAQQFGQQVAGNISYQNGELQLGQNKLTVEEAKDAVTAAYQAAKDLNDQAETMKQLRQQAIQQLALAGNDDKAKAAAQGQIDQYDDAIRGISGLAQKTQSEASRANSKINYVVPQTVAPTPYTGQPQGGPQAITLGNGLTATPTNQPNTVIGGDNGQPAPGTGGGFIPGAITPGGTKKGPPPGGVKPLPVIGPGQAIPKATVAPIPGGPAGPPAPAPVKFLPLPQGQTEASLIANAKDAIAKGAPKAQVTARLRQYVKLPNGW